MIRLSDNYEGRDFSFGYRVNPLRNTNPAEIRDPPIDRNIVPLFDHGHEEPNEEARTIYKDRINQFLADHSKLDPDELEARGKCRKDLRPLQDREYLGCQPSSCASWLLFFVAN